MGNRLLLLRRSEKNTFLPGYYDIPGGKIEEDETPEQALLREVREETNLVVLIGPHFNTVQYKNKYGFEIVETHFFVTLLSSFSSLRLSDEHDEVTLATQESISKLEMSDEMRTWCKKAFAEYEKK